MIKQLFLIAFLLITTQAFAQEILLEQDVTADSVRPSRGPNLKNFTHFYAGLGFPVFTNEEVTYTEFGTSTDVNFGLRYKRKFTNTLAAGADLCVAASSYKIKQDNMKSVPDTIANEKEKIRIGVVSPSVFLRLNIGKRGNYVGNFLDLGAYGGWNIRKMHITVNHNDLDERIRVQTSHLDYVETFTYGLLARAGINRYVVTARYRISDIFKPSYSFPELPRLTVGVEIGLF